MMVMLAPWSKGHKDDIGCCSIPHWHLNLLLGPIRARNCNLLKRKCFGENNFYHPGQKPLYPSKEGDLDDNSYHHHHSGLSFVNTMRRVNRRDDDDEREETFVFDVMASMEHIKMSATMKTATKLKHEIYLINRMLIMNYN